jgi:tetratricopeptide (TPR) repeat protein
MVALIAANADIAEEIELGRTLLVQGHLDTAQRVLVKICQEQPECAEAFRVLAMVLSKRGDDRRARPLVDYAEELEAQRTREIPASPEDLPADAETRQERLPRRPKLQSTDVHDSAEPLVGVRPPVGFEPASHLATPKAPTSALAAHAPGPAPAPPPRPGRAAWTLLTVFLSATLAVGAVVAYKQCGKATHRPSPREELDRSLISGTLERLMRARDVARMALESGSPDVDALVRLGLLNAFLADDYGLEARKDSEDALRRAEVTPELSKEQAAIVASARALLAHAAGQREAAKKFADAALALTPPDSSAFALLASARARSLAGDVEGSTRDLDRAVGIAPELAPVVVDWATSRLDGGDPVAARRALVTLVKRNQDNSRALLLLAQAERALGEPNWVKRLDRACRSDAKISRNIRAACAIESAVQSRIEGDRAGALRKAKAVSQTSEDAQVLGAASLLLSQLGETDAAEEVLDRARKVADPANVSLQWADLSIRLSRGEAVQPARILEHPAGPERDLVALRAAYARAGVAGLAAALKVLPPGIQDIDWDIRAYAVLGHIGRPPKSELATLEKRLDRGSPVVPYVLGLLAVRAKDFKMAMRRLDKALAWHGDICQAAVLYLDAAKRTGREGQMNKTGLRNVHAHNAKCALPEI